MDAKKSHSLIITAFFFPHAGWSTCGPRTSACSQHSVCVLRIFGWLCSSGSGWGPSTLLCWWAASDIHTWSLRMHVNICSVKGLWRKIPDSHSTATTHDYIHCVDECYESPFHLYCTSNDQCCFSFALQSLILSTAVPTIIGFSLWREVRVLACDLIKFFISFEPH